jgi:hypothetical protein
MITEFWFDQAGEVHSMLASLSSPASKNKRKSKAKQPAEKRAKTSVMPAELTQQKLPECFGVTNFFSFPFLLPFFLLPSFSVLISPPPFFLPFFLPSFCLYILLLLPYTTAQSLRLLIVGINPGLQSIMTLCGFVLACDAQTCTRTPELFEELH